jgi:uncharacterized protein YjiS (DUF1127 family)
MPDMITICFLYSAKQTRFPSSLQEAIMSQTVVKLRFSPARPHWQDRVAQAWGTVRASWKQTATRRQLAALDDRALSDIGISRAQAQFLSESPIWDLHR